MPALYVPSACKSCMFMVPLPSMIGWRICLSVPLCPAWTPRMWCACIDPANTRRATIGFMHLIRHLSHCELRIDMKYLEKPYSTQPQSKYVLQKILINTWSVHPIASWPKSRSSLRRLEHYSVALAYALFEDLAHTFFFFPWALAWVNSYISADLSAQVSVSFTLAKVLFFNQRFFCILFHQFMTFHQQFVIGASCDYS